MMSTGLAKVEAGIAEFVRTVEDLREARAEIDKLEQAYALKCQELLSTHQQAEQLRIERDYYMRDCVLLERALDNIGVALGEEKRRRREEKHPHAPRPQPQLSDQGARDLAEAMEDLVPSRG